MNGQRVRTTVLNVACMLLVAGPASSAEADGLVLELVGPDGEPVPAAKVGTGLNVFESSEGHPPQTIVMWLRGNRRRWPFRSDDRGRVVLTGEHARYRQFYALQEARGWAAVSYTHLRAHET